jgi:hypothetical protein
MRGPGITATPLARADGGLDRVPLDRRATLLHLLRAVAVGGERERDLAGRDQAREQRVALAHREAVHARDLAEDLQAALLAQLAITIGEPVLVLGLDAQPPLPSGLARSRKLCGTSSL